MRALALVLVLLFGLLGCEGPATVQREVRERDMQRDIEQHRYYSVQDSIHWTNVAAQRRRQSHIATKQAKVAAVKAASDSTWHVLKLYKVVAQFPGVGIRVWLDARDINTDDSTEMWFHRESMCTTESCYKVDASVFFAHKYFLYAEPLCDVSHWDYGDKRPQKRLHCP